MELFNILQLPYIYIIQLGSNMILFMNEIVVQMSKGIIFQLRVVYALCTNAGYMGMNFAVHSWFYNNYLKGHVFASLTCP